MFEEVLSADAIKAVKSLAPRVGDFYLAGGTALALQLRHRKSDDLDFFSTRPFNTDVLLATIQATRVFFTSQGTIHCEVEGIRVSFLYYEVPLIAAPAVWRGIKVAHWRDIGAEKIKTISQRGAKKDFCDLYAIIKLRASIREVCSVFKTRFKGSGQGSLAEIRGGNLEAVRSRVLGVEGNGGRVYFSTLSEALPERYQFNGRSRNPAKDFFNCLLNYGYGVLYSLVEHGCILAGLDLYRPFAHGQIRRNICSASWASLTWRRFARTKGRSLP